MFINKITRTYSKSINLREYGGPESWVKVESSYEAMVESVDDEQKVSDLLFERSKNDVVNACNEIANKVREKAKGPTTPAPAQTQVQAAQTAQPRTL